MRLFPQPLVIGDTEGFTSEKDIFSRKDIGDGLTNVVTRVKDPVVIAVDSEWGNGKTTFLKMWAGSLRNNNIPVIYFDAFEHDYADDAFTALAGEIVALAKDKKKDNDPTSKRFVEKSLSAAKIILRSSMKIGVKVGTAGVLEAEDFGKVSSDIAKEVSGLEDKYLGELLTKKTEERLTLNAFREALRELPKILSSTTKAADDSSTELKPLIIIIDELDRCRPTFALQVLERMKHFFSVTGVHFVLGVHLGQLRNSVETVYGSGIDGNKYLQKFIHLTITLVDSAIHSYQRPTARYIDYLISASGIGPGRTDSIKSCLKHVAQHTPLSLRAIERITGNLSISLAYKSENVYCPDAILIGLCIIKVIQPELYAQLKAGGFDIEGIETALCLNRASSTSEKHAIGHLRKIWNYFANPDIADDNPDFKGIGERLYQYDVDRFDVVASVARSVVDQLTAWPQQ